MLVSYMAKTLRKVVNFQSGSSVIRARRMALMASQRRSHAQVAKMYKQPFSLELIDLLLNRMSESAFWFCVAFVSSLISLAFFGLMGVSAGVISILLELGFRTFGILSVLCVVEGLRKFRFP